MTKRLLVAFDRNTAGLSETYDYIYDEHGNLEDLLYYWGIVEELLYFKPLTPSSYSIDVIDPELFPRFEKDFRKMAAMGSGIISFDEIAEFRYHAFDGCSYILIHPCAMVMSDVREIMEYDACHR